MDIITPLAAIATQKAIEATLDKICNTLKGKYSSIANKWKTNSAIEQIHEHISDIRNVKTILNFDKRTDLYNFYHQPTIEESNKEGEPRLFTAKSIDDFTTEDNILIEGSAGQGKTILLRFLASQEMMRSKCIPLFLEFRRLSKYDSLSDYAVKELETIGFTGIENEQFTALMKTGLIVLFLDAYDELSEDSSESIYNEIDQLARQHPKLKVIASARPGTALSKLHCMHIHRISPLNASDIPHLLTRMCHDPDTADTIKNGLNYTPTQVYELLNTPLMVALLIIRFNNNQDVPENHISFYQGLFNMLLARHDKSKGGYIRERKSKLPDKDILDTFNAFSLLSVKYSKTSWSDYSSIIDTIQKAIELSNITCSPDDFLNDIISITGIILEDCGEYEVIHKTILEFHAALYIKKTNEANAEKFYKNIILTNTNTYYSCWHQVLYYLRHVDSYKWLKYYELETILLSTNTKNTDIWEYNSVIRHLLEYSEIRFSYSPSDDVYYISSITVPVAISRLNRIDLKIDLGILIGQRGIDISKHVHKASKINHDDPRMDELIETHKNSKGYSIETTEALAIAGPKSLAYQSILMDIKALENYTKQLKSKIATQESSMNIFED